MAAEIKGHSEENGHRPYDTLSTEEKIELTLRVEELAKKLLDFLRGKIESEPA